MLDPKEKVDELIFGILSQRARILEAFAHAYIAETGCTKPSEVELVEEHKDGKVTWHFRRRGVEEKLPACVDLETGEILGYEETDDELPVLVPLGDYDPKKPFEEFEDNTIKDTSEDLKHDGTFCEHKYYPHDVGGIVIVKCIKCGFEIDQLGGK